MKKDNENITMGFTELIEQSRWTAILERLTPEKVYVLTFPSPKSIHSFKSVAYKLNTFNAGRRYSVNANNKTMTVEVTAKEV